MSWKVFFAAASLSLGGSVFAMTDGRHISAALSGAAALIWFTIAARKRHQEKENAR